MPSTTTTLHVPTIDFTHLTSSNPTTRRTAQTTILKACTTHGFFLLTNHGISPILQNSVFTAAKSFFSLPATAKLKIDDKLSYGQSHRGYQVIGGQALGEDGDPIPDLKEGFQMGKDKGMEHPFVREKRMLEGSNLWPSEEVMPDVEEGFKAPLERYFDVMLELSERVMGILGEILELEEGAREIYRKYCEDVISSVRLLHYPAVRDEGEKMGAGAHTDFGGITLLLTDEVPGLQVLHDGVWHDLEPNPEAYIVNVGDALQAFTAGYFKSSTHRVINRSGRERYSVPYFFDGNLDTVLKPLIGGKDKDGKVGGYITVEDHLKERLGTTRKRATENVKVGA